MGLGDILPNGYAIFYLCVALVLLTGDVGWGLCLPDGADPDGGGYCVARGVPYLLVLRATSPSSFRECRANSPVGVSSNLRMGTRMKTPQNMAV